MLREFPISRWVTHALPTTSTCPPPCPASHHHQSKKPTMTAAVGFTVLSSFRRKRSAASLNHPREGEAMNRYLLLCAEEVSCLLLSLIRAALALLVPQNAMRRRWRASARFSCRPPSGVKHRKERERRPPRPPIRLVPGICSVRERLGGS